MEACDRFHPLSFRGDLRRSLPLPASDPASTWKPDFPTEKRLHFIFTPMHRPGALVPTPAHDPPYTRGHGSAYTSSWWLHQAGPARPCYTLATPRPGKGAGSIGLELFGYCGAHPEKSAWRTGVRAGGSDGAEVKLRAHPPLGELVMEIPKQGPGEYQRLHDGDSQDHRHTRRTLRRPHRRSPRQRGGACRAWRRGVRAQPCGLPGTGAKPPAPCRAGPGA
jgi:hypothetical protein